MSGIQNILLSKNSLKDRSARLILRDHCINFVKRDIYDFESSLYNDARISNSIAGSVKEISHNSKNHYKINLNMKNKVLEHADITVFHSL